MIERGDLLNNPERFGWTGVFPQDFSAAGFFTMTGITNAVTASLLRSPKESAFLSPPAPPSAPLRGGVCARGPSGEPQRVKTDEAPNNLQYWNMPKIASAKREIHEDTQSLRRRGRLGPCPSSGAGRSVVLCAAEPCHQQSIGSHGTWLCACGECRSQSRQSMGNLT